jgi:hypothetical protein
VKGAVWLTVGIVVMTVLSMAGMRLLFGYFAEREAQGQAARTTLVPTEKHPLPAEPRLQATPVLDLNEFRAQEEAALRGYGWVDRKAGKVRIPIDRAVDLVAERGLPAGKTVPAPEAAR